MSEPITYRTFKRSATNWKQFGAARKITVDRRLSYDEARRACEAFNSTRTAAQIRKCTRLEFTAE